MLCRTFHWAAELCKSQLLRGGTGPKKPPADEIHIEDVKQINGQWLIAGTSGVILIVIGTGQTMKQAQAQVYSRIKNVLIPNMY